MKYILRITLLLIASLLLSACQETSKSEPYLIDQKEKHPNTSVHLSQEKILERKNKIELAQIAAKSKIEIAKIESKKAISMAKIESSAKKEVAQQASKTKLEISKIDIETRDKQRMINFYIAVAIILTLMLGIFLWYRHKKKSLEMQEKIEANRLKHELAIKEKELQEQRVQKVLDLAISGQLPQELQKDFINSLTKQENRVIESKNS